MTPLVGLVIAVLAALLVSNPRALFGSVLVPMAAATAVQTRNLGSGRGTNPASTIREVSFWVVKLLIVSIISPVAYGIFGVRARHAACDGRSLARTDPAGRRGAELLVAATVAWSGALILAALAVNSTDMHHGQGAGNIPWTGVLGLLIGPVALAVLVGATPRDRRALPDKAMTVTLPAGG